MSFVFPRRIAILISAAAIAAARLFSPVPASAGADGEDKQGAQVRIDASPKVATIGDPIRMDLDVAAPPGFQVEFPALDRQVGDFSILEFAPAAAAPGPEKPRPLTHHRARIIAAVYRTGTFTFPSLELKVRTPDGKQLAASSAPVKIEIRSVLTPQDQNLRDLKKQEEIPERFRWILWLGILAALAAAAILGWIIWKKKHAGRPAFPAAPPRDLLDVAEAELRELLARGFPERGKMKQFYVLLSEIVKRILGAGFGIHTAERTTSEIMEMLRRNRGGDPESTERIESFLLRCDMVKFAKYIPSKDEHQSTADDALWILECSRKLVGSSQPAVGSEVERV